VKTYRSDEQRRDPAQVAEERRKKLRRNWGFIVLAILLVAIILSNLPQASTTSSKQADMKTMMSQVHFDLLGCNQAVLDAFDALQAVQNHTATNLKTADTILSQDLAQCTIVNSDLNNLADYVPTGDLIRLDVQPALNDYYNWAFPNASAVISYITDLTKSPHNPLYVSKIKSRFQIMAYDLKAANSVIATACNEIHMAPISISLFSLKDVPNGLLN
jgi:hypothetical protein